MMLHIIKCVCTYTHIQSTGELQNDERTAAIMLQMMKNSVKLVKSVNGERKSNVQRLSGNEVCVCVCDLLLFSFFIVAYKNYSLVASIWNHKIYVVKRINPET